MPIKYVHTNIIAGDWKRLADFYIEVFGCEPVPPARDLRGGWLDDGTGVSHAHLRGMHLRLPGHGKTGPTLEIYAYDNMLEKESPAANRKGFGHIAFAVDDVEDITQRVINAGGGALGKVVQHAVKGVGLLTFTYLTDPEGNIVEVQHWSDEA
ncbi:VOC family protein [Roseivirga sp. BDSF3-8]|uniref:VOC family protein n=1 Tax=Roseivirga sp. BDSF3-8 TaxID=3241598 RepID=UPI003531A42C